MVLFIPATVLNDTAFRLPRGRWPAWESLDVGSPYDELLGSVVSPLLHACGLLTPAQTSSACSHDPAKGRQPNSDTRQRPVAKWAMRVKLPGFSPGEVTAEVKGGRVVILGRHVQGEGDNQDVVEMKRTVTLPPDVDAEKVVCRYAPGRFVLVEGPRVQREASPATQEVPVTVPGAVKDAAMKEDAPHTTVVVGSPAPVDTKLTQKGAASPTCSKTAAGEEKAIRVEIPDTEAAASCQTSAAESAGSTEETSAMQVAGNAEKKIADAAADEDRRVSNDDSDAVTTAPPSQSAERDAEDAVAKAATTTSCPDRADPQACDTEDAVTKATDGRDGDATTCKLTATMESITQATHDQATSPLKIQEPEKPLSLPSQFEAIFDLRGFQPENVKVTLNGSSLVVKATRVEDCKYFTSKEQFQREVTLPKNVDDNNVRCLLGEDGQLRVTAPYTVAMETARVPIIAA